MEIYKIILAIFCLIALIFILIFSLKSKKSFKTLFLNMITGAITLIILKLISKFTGVDIWINQYTMSLSLVFGIPAVIGLVILKMIFI